MNGYTCSCGLDVYIGDLRLPHPCPPGGWVLQKAPFNTADDSPHYCPLPAFRTVAEAEAWDMFSEKVVLNVWSSRLRLAPQREVTPPKKSGPLGVHERFVK